MRMMNDARIKHADLVLKLAEKDQRLLDMLTVRPHLMNPYPSIMTRLSRRSRKFRRGAARQQQLRAITQVERASHLRLVVSAGVA
jgi:hypothetical protein